MRSKLTTGFSNMEAIGASIKGSSVERWHLRYRVTEDRMGGQGVECRQLFQVLLYNRAGGGGASLWGQRIFRWELLSHICGGGAMDMAGERGDNYWSQVIGRVGRGQDCIKLETLPAK